MPELSQSTIDILSSAVRGQDVLKGYEQYRTEGLTIGSTTALLAEAADASATGATVADGESGDTDFPHGNLKVVATMGERSVCTESDGQKLVGVPDGIGAYLADDETVRVVYQSESYGPIRQESFPVHINGGSATMGGSHVQYVDYDRSMMADFMSYDGPASDMVVGVGNMIKDAFNLKGEPIGPRGSGPTTVGAHYGNTDAAGNYVVSEVPTETDWFYQSFCSAHLEEKHQWGEGIGLEDDIFVTNEEWINYAEGSEFVGLSVSPRSVLLMGVTRGRLYLFLNTIPYSFLFPYRLMPLISRTRQPMLLESSPKEDSKRLSKSTLSTLTMSCSPFLDTPETLEVSFVQHTVLSIHKPFSD